MAKNNLNELSITLLRVVLGLMFAYHGYLKLFVADGFKGTIGFFTAIGLPLPLYSALLASLAEFVGGILLILGFLTRFASVVLIIEMLVAFFKVHLKQGYIISQNVYGYEYIVLILTTLVVILINGSGKLSVGRMFKNKHLH